MEWFDKLDREDSNSKFFTQLRKERLIFDPGNEEDLEELRMDGERIAHCMDKGQHPPPMLWSGIPLPDPVEEATCDYHLVISVGGTKTEFALLRLQRGILYALDLSTGKEVSTAGEIKSLMERVKLKTPVYGPQTQTGREMIQQIVAHLIQHFIPHGEKALRDCEGILLSWGYAIRMVRTEPKLIGGIAGKATAMSKGQVKFTDLKGEDIGALFSAEFKEQLDWPAPVAISNDTVMALHYFLGPDFRPNINNAGLFISGTGTNFAMAEPHAVRSNGFNIGFISKNGEDYQPRRLHSGKDLEEGEISLPFIVNYESGTTELLGTRTRFDTQEIFPIERNALAGGNAFPQQLRQFSQLLFSEEFYRKIQKGWALASGCEPSVEPGAPAVGEILACDGYESLLRMLGDAPLEPTEAAGLRLIAKTIVDRSAMHAALILYAITLRTGFGKGGEGKPDLVGMEGSVWKIRGYSERVKNWWQSLLGEEKLHVIFEKEPSCNASLPGPLYMAALHRQ